MGDTADIRPIWRTPLAAALVAWMALALASALASARLIEVAQVESLMIGAVFVFVVAPAALLAWSLWAMMREPVTGWLAPTVLMAFCGGFAPLFQPLQEASVQLNFEARRPTYEAIIAEARATYPAGMDYRAARWIDSTRDGVRFRFLSADPGSIDFVWLDKYGVTVGVRYDDSPCKPSPTLKCIGRGRPLARHYFHYQDLF